MMLSIRFDTKTALACSEERGWTLKEWADRAGVSVPTLRLFLKGEPTQKLSTIEDILGPLGLRAADILIAPPPLSIRPAGHRELSTVR